MKNFAIIRVEKIHEKRHFSARKNHDFRLREIPNADTNIENITYDFDAETAAQNFDDALETRFQNRRKNAVLLLDYLVTASPEFFLNNDKKKIDEFFQESINFLKEKHGEENILYYIRHEDETTPHLHCMVLPVLDGKLNARHFCGGRVKMRALQDDFAERVEHLGLKRGLKNSDAKHTTIKSFYADINKVERDFENSENRHKYKLIDERNFFNFQTAHTKKHNEEVFKNTDNLYLSYKKIISSNRKLEKQNFDLKKKNEEFYDLKKENQELKKYKNIAIKAQDNYIKKGIKNDKRNKKHDERINEGGKFRIGPGDGGERVFISDEQRFRENVIKNSLDGNEGFVSGIQEECEREQYSKSLEGFRNTIEKLNRAISIIRSRAIATGRRNTQNTRNFAKLPKFEQRNIKNEVKAYFNENKALIQRNKDIFTQKRAYFDEINEIKKNEKLTQEQKKRISKIFEMIKDLNKNIQKIPEKSENVQLYLDFLNEEKQKAKTANKFKK